MKLLLAFFLILTIGPSSAQSLEKLSLISKKVNEERVKKDQSIQVHQFLDNCIYEEKCGAFLKGSIQSYGIIKGTFLGIDRRLRDNQLAKSQFLKTRINTNGKIEDHWYNYKIESK